MATTLELPRYVISDLVTISLMSANIGIGAVTDSVDRIIYHLSTYALACCDLHFTSELEDLRRDMLETITRERGNGQWESK